MLSCVINTCILCRRVFFWCQEAKLHIFFCFWQPPHITFSYAKRLDKWLVVCYPRHSNCSWSCLWWKKTKLILITCHLLMVKNIHGYLWLCWHTTACSPALSWWCSKFIGHTVSFWKDIYTFQIPFFCSLTCSVKVVTILSEDLCLREF